MSFLHSLNKRVTLRGYFILIIIFDLVLLLLFAVGEYHERQHLSRDTIEIAQTVVAGFLAVTNVTALPIALVKNIRRVKPWRMLLVPHLLGNASMNIVRVIHTIHSTIYDNRGAQLKWHMWVCLLLPFVAWHTLSAHVTYRYFRKISLANEDGTHDEDELVLDQSQQVIQFLFDIVFICGPIDDSQI